MTAIPARSSWIAVDIVPSCSWIARLARWMRRLASARRPQQQRVGDQGQQRQPRRQLKQQRQPGRVHQRGVEQVEQPGPEQHAHRAEIVRQPRHDVAGRVAPVERRVQAGQVAEQVAAQPVFDVAAGVEDEDSRPGPDQRLQHREHDDRDRRRARRCRAPPSVRSVRRASIACLSSHGIASENAFVPTRQRHPSAIRPSSGRSVRASVCAEVRIRRQNHAGSIHDLRRIFSLNDRNSRVYSRGLAARAATPSQA